VLELKPEPRLEPKNNKPEKAATKLMMEIAKPATLPSSATVFMEVDDNAIPIHLVRRAADITAIEGLSGMQKSWISVNGFKGEPGSRLIVPAADGAMAVVLFGIGEGETGQPCGAGEWLLGALSRRLPAGNYAIASARGTESAEAAAIAWGLGSYRFDKYRKVENSDQKPARLVIPDGVDHTAVAAITEGVWLGRDMINTPASDLGPLDIANYASVLADRYKADCEVISGDALLERNFPLIHAVGRASPRPPCLIDLRWGRAGAPAITLVGKGISFDTGGLDLKPPSAMLLMKKDMGGAATALSLASMIMGLGIDVRLRVLIAAAENSVAGNAFRPGDVLTSRAGTTVEIGNTDAEGRLVLADALALADEEPPRLLASFATLTGAARVALGPDLPAMFSTDDEAAATLMATGLRVADPVWRMPFWEGYNQNLKSTVAETNNVSDGPHAGAITAALFLKRFVKKTNCYVHFDMFGWRPADRPLGPKGGEPHVARAMLEYVRTISVG